MKLIMLGPPGGGKGTQAEALSKALNLLHVATGDLLREAVASDTSLGRKAKKFMDAGSLVPDAIVVGLLEGKLKSTSFENGFVLDGFPRNLEQARQLEEFTDIDLVLLIDVSFNKLVERTTGRRICSKCGAVYHIMYKPPKKPDVCDNDGGRLYLRDDDREDVVRRRLLTYDEQTRPLINYYESKGKLKRVDGEESIEEVWERLIDVLRDKWPALKLSDEFVLQKDAGARPPTPQKDSQKFKGTRKQRGKGRRGKGGQKGRRRGGVGRRKG